MDRLVVRLLLAGLLTGLWSVSSAQAAEPSVHIVGPIGQVQTGTIWPVEVRIDTGGTNINAAELQLIVTGVGTEITRLGRESSIMTLWPETPSINGATAKFVGGRPGGVVAVDALVGTMFIVARQAGPVTIALLPSASGLYRHDGAGTKVEIGPASAEIQVADDLVPSLAIVSRTHPDEASWGRAGEIEVSWAAEPGEEFSYRLSSDIGTVPDDDIDTGTVPLRFNGLDDGIWYFTIKHRRSGETWSPIFQRRFLLDRTAPEPFELTSPEPRTVGGRSVLTWTAIDRTSGLAAYRALVNGQSIGVVTSPLTLRPEWRGHRIHIVAVDAAGNQRLSEPWLFGARRSAMPWWSWFVIALASLSLAFAAGRVFRRRV